MIYCSNLPNDQDMIQAIRRQGGTVIPASMSCGDACFYGTGVEDGSQLKVCIERKRVPDMAKCILGGRYLHQLQLAYEGGFRTFVLILEGRYDRSRYSGLVTVPGRMSSEKNGWKDLVPSISFSRFEQYLTELEYLAGIIVKRSENVQGTAAVILSQYEWFQRRPEDHKSLRTIYKPVDSVPLHMPSLVRRVASELPGVGWKRSGAVAEHFRSVADMVCADEKTWRSVDGIGKVTAGKITDAIRGIGNT